MVPTATRPTRITHTTATLIDNIYMKVPSMNNTFTAILTSDISDHFPVIVFNDTKHSVKKSPVTVTSRKLDNTALEGIKEMLSATDWSQLYNLNVGDKFQCISQKVLEHIDIYAPLVTRKIPYQFVMREPWMTILCSSITLDKMRKMTTGKNPDKVAVKKFAQYRNIYNYTKRKAKSLYYGNLLEQFKGDMKKTWTTLKKCIGKHNDKTACTSFIGRKNLILKLSVKNFAAFFTNVGSKLASSIPQPFKSFRSHMSGAYENSLFLSPTDPMEIFKIIKNTKPQKSFGHDGISSDLLKKINGEIALPLSIAINDSISNAVVPENLKTAKVVPIYKAKQRNLLTNYRPISLLPCLSKILEKGHTQTIIFIFSF